MLRLQLKFLDTKPKRHLIFSFILFYPVVSMLFGAPIPVPVSLFTSIPDISSNITPAVTGLINFISLLITLTGAIIAVGFYLEKRNNQKIESASNVITEKVDVVDEKLDESVIIHHEDIKRVCGQIKEMENRLSDSITSKNTDMEKNMNQKVVSSIELANTKFKHIEVMMNGMQKSIDFMQQFQWGTGAKSVPPFISGSMETREHREKPQEGMYLTPDSSETQIKKDEREYRETKKEIENRNIEREKASKKRWEQNALDEEKEMDGEKKVDE